MSQASARVIVPAAGGHKGKRRSLLSALIQKNPAQLQKLRRTGTRSYSFLPIRNWNPFNFEYFSCAGPIARVHFDLPARAQ
jgi:hypothetical protein